MTRPDHQLCARFTRLLGFVHMHPLGSEQELAHAERCMKHRYISSCTSKLQSPFERGDYLQHTEYTRLFTSKDVT
jgi:hypothetical protein